MKLMSLVFFTGLAMSVRSDEPTNATPTPEVSGPKVETIVCVRHGEKPKGGLGQLSCRGLNRALALPNVLLGKFGTPQYVFAPNPTEKSDMLRYYYVRPLMTIEPTAIRCGLPVNTEFGFTKIEGLEHELLGRKYENAVVFVAWEHYLLDHFVKDVLKANGGDPKQVPSWPESDYDTIFVIKITQSAAGKSVTFAIDHEGLNNLSDTCP